MIVLGAFPDEWRARVGVQCFVSCFFFASGRNFFNLGWGGHQILSTWQCSKIHSCGHSDLKIDLCKCHCERHWVSWKLIEHVFVLKPRWQDVSKVRPARFSNAHRTNVWYVYLHLLQTSTKRGKIYHTPILCDMASWKKNSEFCPEWLERSWKIHPRKLTWIPKIAIFERRYIFQTIAATRRTQSWHPIPAPFPNHHFRYLC